VIWAPRAGVAYLLELGSGVTLKPRAAIGTSLRPPRPGQTGGAASQFYIQRANPNLRPEVQRGFDAGFDLDIENGRVALEATYFNQTAKDLIDGTTLSYSDGSAGSNTITQYQNVGEVGNHGLELGLHSRLGFADLTGSYTYTKSDVKSLSPAYQGLLLPGDQLLYVPQHTAGGTLAFNVPSFANHQRGRSARLEVGATYIGSRRTEDAVGFVACLYKLSPCVNDSPSLRDYWPTLPSFVKLRAGVTEPVSDRLAVFLNVDNLSNRQTGELYTYSPSRGRTVLLGVRFGE
jgi:outer membrane receptor protein involved in Fe transport